MAKERTVLFLSTTTHILIDSLSIGLAIVLAEIFGKEQKYASVGTILAFFTLATAFSEPVWGKISDLSGKRGKIVSLGLLFSGLFFSSLSLYGFIPFPPLLFLSAAAFLTGIAAGTYHSVATTMLNENVESGNRGFYQGINNAGGSLGRTLAPVVLAFLFSKVSFFAGFAPYLVFGSVLGISSMFIYPEEGAARKIPPPGRVKQPMLDGFVWTLMSISFLRTAFFLTTMNFLPSFLIGYKGFGSLKTGYIMTSVLATGIIAQPIGGKLSDSRNRPILMAGLLFLSGLLFVLFLCLPFALSLVSLSLSFFSLFMTFPIMFAIIGDEIPRKNMGYITGLISGAGGLSATILQLCAGLLAEAISPWTVLVVLALFPLMSGLAALSLRRDGGSSSRA